MIPINFLVIVSLILLVLGMLTVLVRRNILMILMGLELMFNSAALLFITYARMHGEQIKAATDAAMYTAMAGHFFTLFIFVVAAVEVGLMIAIILNIFKLKRSLLTSNYSLMKR